jgi:chromosomal replication initiator protein
MALEAMQNQVDEQEFATWLRPLRVLGAEDGEIRIAVQNTRIQDYVVENHQGRIEHILEALTGGPVRVLFQVVSKGPELFPDDRPDDDLKAEVAPSTPGLSPNYHFDSFVMGSSNQMAYTACKAVAERPGTNYNPLFIYGGTGLGKTHLLQAIGHHLLAHNRNARVLYVTCEDWLNAYINAVQRKNLEYFRGQFRDKVDLLLVDDIQFLAGKERFQEEFFHTFNALHGAGKQVAFTSDRMPSEIRQIEDRLRSRFSWGLIADIKAPDFETRLAILKDKAERFRITVPQDVLEYIATNISTNVRELESCLKRLECEADIRACSIDARMAKEALKTIIKARAPKVTPEKILMLVAARFNITVADMKSSTRTKSITEPRQMAMYLCRKLTTMSLPEIGDTFGGRNHSTVLSSVKKVENQVRMDSEFASVLEELIRKLS